MKKVSTVFLAFIIIIISLSPISVLAKDKNNDEGMYKISEKVYADAYMLINLDDDTHPVIAQKNKDKKKYPASLTKIATAMVTINNVKDLSKKIAVPKEAIDALSGTGAQVAGLKPNEIITIEKLLYLTLIHSACDACQVLALYVGGSVENYVKMMNDWAASLGCKNTHFVNPDGLHDKEHYTTAADLELMTLEALKSEVFTKIATTRSVDFHGHTLIHTNFMMDRFHITYYYEYAEGIKTGSTTEAGYCLITMASKNGYNYLAVILDSPIKKLKGIDTKCSYIDAKTMFEWAFNSLKYSMVLRKNDVIEEIPVLSGKDSDTVQLVAGEDVNTLVPMSLDPSAVIVKPVDMPESVEAPINKGDKICTAEIIYANKVIGTVDLVSGKTVELSTFLKFINAIKAFFENKAVITVIALLFVGFIIYILIFIKRLKNARKRAAAKRRRREELEEQINSEYQSRRRGRDDYLPPPKR